MSFLIINLKFNENKAKNGCLETVLSKTIIILIMYKYMRKNVKIVLFDWYIKFFNY